MKIAVNARLLLKDKLEGIGYFSFEVLQRLVKSMPDDTFYFIFDRPFDTSFVFADNVKPIVVAPPSRHPLLWIAWFEIGVARALKRIKPDVFFSPDGYCTLNTQVRTIMVCHDVGYKHYPLEIPSLVRWYYQFFTPLFLSKAARIVTVSEFNKQDILTQFPKINPEKISVVHNAARPIFNPISDTEKEIVRAEYTNGAPYFIYVGAIHPRKNVDSLIKAFDIFKNSHLNTVKLVLVGRLAWQKEKVLAAFNASPFKSDIVFLGYTPEENLPALLGAAVALTYMSLFEGFGMPLVEALSCDVPVITSNVTAMPEVAQGAAILVDPKNINAIADAMRAIYSDTALREKLISAGRKRKNDFSWDTTAKEIRAVILDCPT